MAILYPNLYTDYKCTNPGLALTIGIAAATGWAADPTHWNSVIPSEFSEAKILWTNARTIANNNGSITLSGGAALYNNAVAQSIPWYNEVDTDKEMNGSSNVVYNPLFCSYDAENNLSYYISLAAFNPTNDKPQQYVMHFGYYNQEPEDASGNDRTSWRYWKYSTIIWPDLFYPGGVPLYWPSEFSMVKVYKLMLGEVEHYLFAFGVSADNRYNVQQNITFGTDFVAIPVEFFKDKEAKPWAGDESEDDAENSFYPTTPYRDSVSSRDLTGKRNPYGFNTGNGMKLAVIGYRSYAKILQGIYCGSAEGLLNRIAQAYYELAGGNDHRQAEEIQSIVSAVLCCHLIPKITGILSGDMTMRTIAGYHIFGQNLDGGQYITVGKTDDTIFGYDSQPKKIEPRLNSFLDYEPYTSITLHLPFMSSVNLQPSALYGNYLYVHYEMDIYTGILSADVIISEPVREGREAREYIISTQQANVRTEIPIMGNGANGAPLAQIASSVLGVARSGSPELAAAAGIVSGVDELSKASTGVAVGRNTVEGIGSYLSSRSAYLIITRPEPANPSNFLEMEGSTANLPGVVGDFTGFSIFDDVKLEGFSATDDEKKAIEALLKGGVFV